ncbi:hypothetical protein ABK040_000274 [Willaertia magna]
MYFNECITNSFLFYFVDTSIHHPNRKLSSTSSADYDDSDNNVNNNTNMSNNNNRNSGHYNVDVNNNENNKLSSNNIEQLLNNNNSFFNPSLCNFKYFIGPTTLFYSFKNLPKNNYYPLNNFKLNNSFFSNNNQLNNELKIIKIEKERFNNSFFIILYSDGTCQFIDKLNHLIYFINISINEPIIDISTTELHFICCTKKKVFHIKLPPQQSNSPNSVINNTTINSTINTSINNVNTTINSNTTFINGSINNHLIDNNNNITKNEIKINNLKENENILKIETGKKFFIILTNEGRIFGFGHNKQKQFSSNMEEQLKTPTEIILNNNENYFIKDIAADNDHLLLLTRENKLFICGNSMENLKWKFNTDQFLLIDVNVDWMFFRGNTLLYKKLNNLNLNNTTVYSIGNEIFQPNFTYYPTALFFTHKISTFYGYKNNFIFQDEFTKECFYFSTTYGLIKLEDLNLFLKERPYLNVKFYCSSDHASSVIIYFQYNMNCNYLPFHFRKFVIGSNNYCNGLLGDEFRDVVLKFK